MKKFLSLFLFSMTAITCAHAQQAGDTISVQTFTYGAPQNDTFLFPPDTFDVEKILMHYTLKCNPNQNPACGEWDYLTYTNLYDHTGVLDSTLYTAPSFTVSNESPDTFVYMVSPGWNYSQHFDYFIVYDDTTSLVTANVGSGTDTIPHPFNSAFHDSRSQYIWLASELAGLGQGEITGLAFDFAETGSELKNLQIRMKNSSLDSLSADSYEAAGLQTVYESSSEQVTTTGNHVFNFTEAFNWDGSSNLVVDICFDHDQNGTANTVHADSTGWYSGITAAENDFALDFEGPDYVEVPAAAFAEVDSFITVMFWQYGDPGLQPQNNYTFEGRDANNNRVINSHLPWGNGRVYWDAGNDGGDYDRIDKQANEADYEGQWNHWTFTKSLADGSMKIYLNGELWHSGTGHMRDMSGITQFKIGARADNGNGNYDGMIDEFSVWKSALDSTTIQQWMKKDLDNTHPAFADLLVYYQFNEGNGYTAVDGSANNFDGTLIGMPAWRSGNGCELFRNVESTSWRPNIIFEQGEFTSHLDSTAVVDSTMNDPLQLIHYADSLNPLTATDTQIVWSAYYNDYVFDNMGNATDSSLVTPDDTIFLNTWEYYGEPFEVVDRYELFRFITPYGIGLDLHDGFTWTIDVSDYEPLLHDSVHLSAGNWQELLDLRFDFIVGTPPREVKKVENVWQGNYSLNSFDDEVVAKTLGLDPVAQMFRLKTRTTGHGFDNPTNCAEFCHKMHSVDVNGNTEYNWQIIQECSDNPLYPQGGTWVYDRAGWCPGAPGKTQNLELTPFINGDSVTVDYNIQSDQYGNYVFEGQLISYGDINHSLDAAVVDIIAPSNQDIHYRENAICTQPMITIQNTGSTPLASLDIEYGIEGQQASTYQWTGNLEFLEKATVQLDDPVWAGISSGTGTFAVNISNPNGGQDEYAYNNSLKSQFKIPNILDYSFVIWLKTNNQAHQNSYTLKDEAGNILYSRNNLQNNTLYQDTVNLPLGCFVFEFNDLGEDGIDWWANPNAGSGYIRFRGAETPVILENFDSYWTLGNYASQYRGDFGKGFTYHFTTAFGLSVDEAETIEEINVFPNPSNGDFLLDLALNERQQVKIEIHTSAGQRIYSKELEATQYKTLPIDIEGQANGIYLLHIITEKKVITKKLIINK